jgi:hypothetical protein
MKARFALFLFCLFTVLVKAQGNSAFHPGQVWLDDKGVAINAHGGGILYKDGTYYWFGEHKTGGPGGNQANVGVHCYSSTDLYNWKDEGIALAVSSDDTSDIAKGCILERPKVIYNQATKKYVMWFHLELKGHGYSAARCGVATSDTVTGPYAFQDSFRPDDHESRDMTLFQDDDGKAYLICASEGNTTTHISPLTDDYLHTTGNFIRAFKWWSEAPAIFKHAGKYYYIGSGCSGWKPNAAMSAVADSMLGPWKGLGNPCRGDANHKQSTFESQSTFVLPVAGKPDAFIFMGDRWRPGNAIDGRYVWLPIQFEDDKPVLNWLPEWSLGVFDSPSAGK